MPTPPRPSTHSRRPRVAVVHDLGSASPHTVRAAAGRSYQPLFVCDFALPRAAADAEALAQVGGVVDVTGLGAEERVAALAAHEPDGVTTFSEARIRETAQLARRLGLAFHDPATAVLLTDKVAQRARLREAGVDATASVPLTGDVAAHLAAVGLPAVIKPRVGAGSTDTYRVRDLRQAAEVVAALPHGRQFVVESMLRGDPDVAGHAWGDYVSVESVHLPDGGHQVCVTGKFPLGEPFRETGMVMPSTLDDASRRAVLELEAAAVRALGVRHGITHTEIKLTPDGPRIIEVNGRLGGYVGEILRRATGVNLMQVALAAAVGDPVRLPERTWSGVTYQYFLTAPADVDGVLARPLELTELSRLPGIDHVDLQAFAGRRIDWRDGTQGHLGVVYGSAPDHAAAAVVVAAVDAIFLPALRAAVEPNRVHQ